MENFIGKKVTVTVAFAERLVNAGSVPKKFMGVLEKIDGDFLIFSNVKVERINFTTSAYVDFGNYVIINKQYVVLMVEI